MHINLLAQIEVAEILGISPRTLERKRVAGDGPPYVKLGRSVRYVEADLIQWVEDRRRNSTSEQGGRR
jgi:predicted DNA-binding transcriptional regulator AlpA